MNDTVIAIVSAFFIIGIAVGIVVVVAMSVLRDDRRGDPGDPVDPMGYEPRGPGQQPPGPRWDDVGSDERPRWPEAADRDFSDR